MSLKRRGFVHHVQAHPSIVTAVDPSAIVAGCSGGKSGPRVALATLAERRLQPAVERSSIPKLALDAVAVGKGGLEAVEAHGTACSISTTVMS
jgi:hypothetical protein